MSDTSGWIAHYDALDTLRLEKGFVCFGGEVTSRNNPFECGLDRWIKFDDRSFVGKETLLKLRERGPECKLVGLELQSDATATTTQQVIANGRTIGEIALGFRGLTVGKNLAWAYVAQGHTRAGTQALVAFKDRNVQATIVDIRCYDPNDTRIRS